MDVKIIKKDGSQQEFDIDKVANSVINARALDEQVEAVTKEINNWIKGYEGGSVNTNEIASKVIEVLEKVNPEAAKAYEDYRLRKNS